MIKYEKLPDDAKPVPKFDGYYATPDGRVFSDRRGSVHELEGSINEKIGGYRVVTIMGTLDGEPKQMSTRAHRLVLAAFKGWKSYPTNEACHRNGDPLDNRIENLYWGTSSDNYRDMRDHGTLNFVKLTRDDVVEIRHRYFDDQAKTQAELAEEYGVCRSAISGITTGRTWTDAPGPTSRERIR